MKDTILFKLPGRRPLPVKLSVVGFGPHGYINFYHNGDIVGTLASNDMASFADKIKRTGDRLTPRSVAEMENHRRNVLEMSPADVIEYFIQSPILAHMAEDVREALEKVEGDHTLDINRCRPYLDQIIDHDGQIIWGAQTRIAEILGIDNAGQANRKRIKAVVGSLARKNSTTTTPAPVTLRAAA